MSTPSSDDQRAHEIAKLMRRDARALIRRAHDGDQHTRYKLNLQAFSLLRAARRLSPDPAADVEMETLSADLAAAEEAIARQDTEAETAIDDALTEATEEIAALRERAEQAEADLARRDDAAAEALAGQTRIRELSVKDSGINLDLIPPHEIALLWVHAARGMLGDAPNYSETPVEWPREAMSMEVKAAGEYESFVLTVQRKGKITPHEARQAAEAERDQLSAQLDRVHEVCDRGEWGAVRWADPLPVPEWVDRVRAAIDGELNFHPWPAFDRWRNERRALLDPQEAAQTPKDTQ